MSFESLLHLRLVHAIVHEIMQRHGDLYSLTLYADLPEYRRDKPYRFGGFMPDVFAIDAPETCRIIGEAKTPVDFESERSQMQIASFLSHLSKFPNSYFYLGVPWRSAARARSVLDSLAAGVSGGPVSIHVIEGFV